MPTPPLDRKKNVKIQYSFRMKNTGLKLKDLLVL